MNILFLCVANSARSQLAEAMGREIFPKSTVVSAGSEPSGKVHPCALEVLKELGLNTAAHYSKGVSDINKDVLAQLDFVITLCADEVCPVIQTKAKRLHWPLPDPGHVSEHHRLDAFRNTASVIRDKLIELKVKNLSA